MRSRHTSPNASASRALSTRRWRRRAWLGASLIIALVSLVSKRAALAQTPQGTSYLVIVNPANAASSLERTFVAQAFLKKVHTWPNGDAIDPVDLVESSPVRASWTSDILNRSIGAVKTYWQQRIFSGRDLPPPEVKSNDDVVSYVLRTPGGIGYVGSGANLRGAKALPVR